MAHRILITMDDLEAAVRLNAAFEASGYETAMVSALDDVNAAVLREDPDLLLLTGGLHEPAAARLLSLVRDGRVATLGLLEPTDAEPAAVAQRMGLTAAVVKPADAAETVALCRRLIERKALQERTGILGDHPAIQEVLIKLEQMAPVSSTVLIEGESGTGKELVARAIHDLSPRRAKPFIAVNCAALPESLLESELFGHEKGSFTDAVERRLGRFELADTGTIFLDEVGEMPVATQVKLLRVLEEREFFRVGGAAPIKVDVRVVAATNRPLRDAMASGELRSDLYYRLNVLSIYLPPLRERRSDIPLLVRRFIHEFSKLHDRPFRGIAPAALQILVDAPWPGNVRQLRNLVESMVVLAPTSEIRPEDIPREIREQGRERLLPVRVPGVARGVSGQELTYIVQSLIDLRLQVEDLRRRLEEHPQRVEVIEVPHEAPEAEVLVGGADRLAGSGPGGGVGDRGSKARELVVYEAGMRMADVERAAIEAALAETRGNRRKAAEMLGIGERTLYRKLKDYEAGGAPASTPT
ncbi:MAG TPA: sigma-54 dependent transcriptional regulator [Gemmatimonadales bacterium]|nr:sigma-54 dependent transcriptional regulator [Gemmatimonadales bacterium]